MPAHKGGPVETILVGADFGQSESTFASAGGKGGFKVVTFPSMVGTGQWEDLWRLRQGAGPESAKGDDMVVAFEGVEYFVGSLALEQSGDATTERGNPQRYFNGHSLRLLLAYAGRYLSDNAVIRVVTGMPIEVWTKERVRLVQLSLCGRHEFEYRGKSRTLVVDAVGVLMEGRAILHDVCHEEVPQVCLDIGGGSFDIFYAIGNNVIREKCKGTMVGVEKIGVLISRAAEAMGRPLEPFETRALIRAYGTKTEMPAIFVDGAKWMGAQNEVASAVARVSDELTHFASVVLGKARGRVAGEAPHVRLVGGGYYYFYKGFKDLIPHLRVPAMPENQNAISYYLVAQSTSDLGWSKSRG
jgi:hypothetical protein